jgi:electron transport complex protein RnfD
MAETKETGTLHISNAPHISTGQSVPLIMWTVVAALMPAAIYSVYIFGLNSLVLLLSGVIAAVAAEAVFQLGMKGPLSVSDGSAVITGLLVAMNVPPAAPWWIVAIGSFFAIIIVKQLFGGLGFNVFNPALAARAFMLASWPVHMTTGWHEFSSGVRISSGFSNSANLPPEVFDALSGATHLTALKEAPKLVAEYNVSMAQINEFLTSQGVLKSLFLGNVGGCIGETSVLFLLLGGLFLLIRRIITWHIPVTYMGTVALLALVYYALTGNPNPHMAMIYHILSGGLVLGAFFMATDMTTSPVTPKGMIIFAAGCGIITFVIRIWGGYPEGVSYSILLMNAVVPLIDRYTRPKIFGREEGEAGA